ncbi:MAG: F0F1 ATP synthase subunit A [Cyanobacteriota bacterium]
MQINIGDHWLGDIPFLPSPINTVHLDTIITSWIAMAVVIILALIITRNLNRVPGKIQIVAEGLMKFLDDISVSQMGKEGIKHTPLIASLFLFILAANLLNNIPLKLIHLPDGEFASPTNDLNVTASLAILVSIYYFGAGIAKKGFGYFKHYFKPFPVLAPLNFLEDFTRPVSLSVRLFGNILAGEVIIGILIAFFFMFSQIIAIIVIPVESVILVFVLFELFIAVIQAFIFAVLSASYVAMATSDDH